MQNINSFQGPTTSSEAELISMVANEIEGQSIIKLEMKQSSGSGRNLKTATTLKPDKEDIISQ